MKVSDLKAILNDVDDELDVCVCHVHCDIDKENQDELGCEYYNVEVVYAKDGKFNNEHGDWVNGKFLSIYGG